MTDCRPDGYSWFKRWWDAYHQAALRADLTGRRYRVYYDAANRWWFITELTSRHGRSSAPSITPMSWFRRNVGPQE